MTRRTPKGPVICRDAEELRVARVAGYTDDEIIYQGQRLAATPVIGPAPIARVESVRADIDIATLAAREFDGDAAIRAEFGGDKQSYVSYRKAESAGLIKFLGTR